MIGLQIAMEFRRGWIRDERFTHAGDLIQQILRIDLRHFGDDPLSISAEILIHQLCQRNLEDITDMNDQTQRDVFLSFEHVAEVALPDIKTPLLEHFLELDLTVAVGAHERVELFADRFLVFRIHITGGCGDRFFCHDHDLPVQNFSNFIIFDMRQKAIDFEYSKT